jgi:hypothetical protein
VRRRRNRLGANEPRGVPYWIGFEDGEGTGEARSTRQGEAQIVRRLLERLDLAEVADLLGLTPEEVAEIVAKGGEVSPDPG